MIRNGQSMSSLSANWTNNFGKLKSEYRNIEKKTFRTKKGNESVIYFFKMENI